MVAPLPSGRRGRFLALAITAILLLVAWQGVAVPLFDYYQDRAARLQQRQDFARHMQLAVAALPELRAQVAASASAGPASVAALQGDTDAVAGANLQNLIREMASKAAASLTSVEGVEAEDEQNGYRRIGIRIALSARWPVLVALLRAIGQSPLPMLIDDLQIHSPPLLAPAATGVPMQAEFTVYAFRAGGAAPAKKS